MQTSLMNRKSFLRFSGPLITNFQSDSIYAFMPTGSGSLTTLGTTMDWTGPNNTTNFLKRRGTH